MLPAVFNARHYNSLRRFSQKPFQIPSRRHIAENGLNVGSLSKNRLGTLLRNLNVVDQKERRKIKGIKIVYYLIRPELVRKVAENYRVK
jgi:hypothetical protein